MADPILHVKDSYYFEVPKFLWRRDWKSLDEVPESFRFLKDAHPHASVDEFNHELSGKVVIPQPFGELGSLYHAQSGLCISRFMIIEVVAAAIIVFLFARLAKQIGDGSPARGKLANALEFLLLFVRDQIARPAIGHEEPHAVHARHGDGHHGHGHHGDGHHGDGHHGDGHHGEDPREHGDDEHHAGHGHATGHDEHGHAGHEKGGHGHHHDPRFDGDRFVPLLWTLFMFILVSNLMGLIPWLGTSTGSWGATAALALVTLLTVFISGMRKFGVLGFWANQVPHMELPAIMSPLKFAILILEVVGLLIKHAVLSIRLLFNMAGGHLVLGAILGLAVMAAQTHVALWGTVTFFSVVGSSLLCLLELLVALLQAYVFTFLSALFISAAVHSH